MRIARPCILALAATLVSGVVEPGHAQTTRAPPPSPRSNVKVETFARGLEHPWGLQFLPDGRLIVSERPGRIRLIGVDGQLGPALAGVPKVAADNQGGMLDLALAPDFPESRRIYFCFSEPRGRGSNGSTVARARLEPQGSEGRLEDVQIIFRQEPAATGGLHFGCRLAFARDGNLFVAVGERYEKETAQSLSNHRGKVLRIEPDGSVPKDNPFVGQGGARPEIWTYGHRNPQAAAINPVTGKLWVVEHGPRGGDEVNVIERGRNYGWPVIGYGIDYSGEKIHASTHKDGMEQPIYYWVPSIAPSGMAFYTSDAVPGWKGSLLVGALAGHALHRLVLDGEKVIAEETLLADLGERIRDVRMKQDGSIWLLTDAANGRVLKVTPTQ